MHLPILAHTLSIILWDTLFQTKIANLAKNSNGKGFESFFMAYDKLFLFLAVCLRIKEMKY